MNKYLVLAVYRCEYAGKDAKDRDFQAILVHALDWQHAMKKVSSQRTHKYRSVTGEWVKWPLVHIMAIEKIDGHRNLDEITGFIADKAELFGRNSLIRPSLREMLKPRRAARR